MTPERRTVRTSRVTVSSDRGVFMISVAAELAEMHPQTLRMYEAKGLISPRRSARGTRLYSQADVERLRRIQQMTAELGLNLAGVQRVLELEERLEESRLRARELEQRAKRLQGEMEHMRQARARLSAEIVPYAPGGVVARRQDVTPPARGRSASAGNNETTI